MKKILLFLFSALFLVPSFALERQIGDYNFKLTASGSAGMIDNNNFNYYLLRGEINRDNFGAVYSYDSLANLRKQFAKDAFVYMGHDFGRIEVGWTESVAAKLALTLPDVGGTRLNNQAFFYDDFVGITNPVIYGTEYAWRVNMIVVPSNEVQAGFARTVGNPAGFNSATDFGFRYKNPNGNIKTSFSFGFSYIDNLKNFISDEYLPPTYADSRYVATTGFNMQSGSLLWAITGKKIIDYKAVGIKTDGWQAGTGFSYEFLSWATSVNYIFSDSADFLAHTIIGSLRYKITRNFNVWGSAGVVYLENFDDNRFVSFGLGVVF